jgi:hypothetical protein
MCLPFYIAYSALKKRALKKQLDRRCIKVS